MACFSFRWSAGPCEHQSIHFRLPTLYLWPLFSPSTGLAVPKKKPFCPEPRKASPGTLRRNSGEKRKRIVASGFAAQIAPGLLPRVDLPTFRPGAGDQVKLPSVPPSGPKANELPIFCLVAWSPHHGRVRPPLEIFLSSSTTSRSMGMNGSQCRFLWGKRKAEGKGSLHWRHPRLAKKNVRPSFFP